MIYFYARVSTVEQNLARQIEAAKKYKGVDEIFSDKMSGKNFNRVEYQRMKSMLQKGDEVVVKSLDRLGRDKNLVKDEIQWFKEHGVKLRILDIPTTLIEMEGQEWVGDMVTNILIEVMASVAEQERMMIRERQREGIEAKRKSGTWDEYGRPKKNTDGIEDYWLAYKSGEMTREDCCKALGISPRTLYNRAKELNLMMAN
uniref:Gamma delta Resolvase, site specific recombination n=1 Tax=Siphoviridae sp. ctzyE57 TaxID=2827982 RepID=A0A8S5SGC2_9CAUD|nr:MAG TPA: gamma delta Resolvase, site specific recombination [Siphoviridae sp. ctzyE57]